MKAKILNKKEQEDKYKYWIMLGDQNSGKTTILYYQKFGAGVLNDIIPTIGFNAEQFNDNQFAVFDVGGSPQIRATWPNHYDYMYGLIFVLRSDIPLLEQATIFGEVTNNDLFKKKCKNILIFVNRFGDHKEGDLPFDHQ